MSRNIGETWGTPHKKLRLRQRASRDTNRNVRLSGDRGRDHAHGHGRDGDHGLGRRHDRGRAGDASPSSAAGLLLRGAGSRDGDRGDTRRPTGCNRRSRWSPSGDSHGSRDRSNDE